MNLRPPPTKVVYKSFGDQLQLSKKKKRKANIYVCTCMYCTVHIVVEEFQALKTLGMSTVNEIPQREMRVSN